MTASLPMYYTAATSAAYDTLWSAIRQKLGRGPLALDRETDPHQTWKQHDLVLSQTCGLPYRSTLHGHVKLVGTPDYGIDGCQPGYYRSVIVVRKDEKRRDLAAFRGATLARNDERSQSGWAAIAQELNAAGAGPVLGNQIVDTGSHAASALAVAEGRADFAAVDAVTWALLERDTDSTRDLRVLSATRPTPGLPFITSSHECADQIFDAVADALSNLSADHKKCTMIKGIVRIQASAYLDQPLPQSAHCNMVKK